MPQEATHGELPGDQRFRQPSRRQLLKSSLAASLATLAFSGCRSESEQESVPDMRTDVPLRLLWVGAAQDAETVKRKWEAVSQQPINVTTVELDRGNPSGLTESILGKHKSFDLMVYPLMAVAELVAAGALIPSSEELLGGGVRVETSEDESDNASTALPRLYPVLRNGVAMFAGQAIGMPLGAHLPAVLSLEPIDALPTWGAYDQWVDQEWKGAAAEPLADGWAGQSFLWRAASAVGSQWLFGGESMEPQIAQSEYVDVLEQMVQTAKRYNGERKNPREIWLALLAGELQGGIGWQVPSENDSVEIAATNLPSNIGVERVLLDSFAPIISVSSACRQTSASNELVRWISAGEGSEGLRGQISVVTPTRVAVVRDTIQAKRESQYDAWLRSRLEVPITLPTLQILAGDEYYGALDQQVVRCLNGKSKPVNALAEVATAWSALHAKVGVKEQERAWRRAQGSRA